MFGLGQTINQKATIEAVAQYLSDLILANLNKANFIRISEKDVYKKTKPFIYLTI